MSSLAPRSWVPQASDSYVQRLAAAARQQDSDQLEAELLRLTAENKAIHEQDCINLNIAQSTFWHTWVRGVVWILHKRQATVALNR